MVTPKKKLSKIAIPLVISLLVAGIGIYFFFLFLKPGAANRGWPSDGTFGQRPGGAQDFGSQPQTTTRPRWNGPIPQPPKEKITYYQGLWAGTWFYPEQYSGQKPKPEEYKSWGVNIVNIQPGFEINSRGETRYPLDYPTYKDLDAWFGQLAEMFYKNGIHLGMTVMIHYKETFVRGVDWGGETAYVPKEKIQTPGYLKNYDTIVAEMAKIAQKYHFYFFSPMGEPENVFLDARLASDWSQQILPKIKKIYKGKIYYKGDLHKGEGNTMNFKGYDILGMVTSPVRPGAAAEEYRAIVNSSIDRVLPWAKRDGVKEVVISEHGNSGDNKMDTAANIGYTLETANNRLNGMFLTEPFPAVLKTNQGNQIVEQMKKWFLQ